MSEHRVIHSDCVEAMRAMPEASVDAIVTDPPYGLEFMGKEWDRCAIDPGVYDSALRVGDVRQPGDDNYTEGSGPFARAKVRYCGASNYGGDLGAIHRRQQEWHLAWCEQALRVLKPGGWLVSFGGTRTYHRMACAIEDAGFEIRDSLHWIYGSGFPKSLDVSKAIDAAAGAEREVVGLKSDPRYLSPRTNSPNHMDRERGVEGGHGAASAAAIVTAPATPEAAAWDGWGTALKPAHEPIVLARKPLGGSVNVRVIVENGLRSRGVTGEIRWTRPASDAAGPSPQNSSSSIGLPTTAATSVASADASATANDAPPTPACSAARGVSGATETLDERPSIDGGVTRNSGAKSSRPTAARAYAAASKSPTSSPSITSAVGEPDTAANDTARSTPNCGGSDSPLGSECFAGIATGLPGSTATVHITRLPDGRFAWPADLPEVVTSGPTVAANVLAHGTGGLNVDGCRVEGVVQAGAGSPLGYVCGGGRDDGYEAGTGREYQSAGRWPPNLLLDEHAAAEMDRQSGDGGEPFRITADDEGRADESQYRIKPTAGTLRGFGDSGGASRFFPVFRYVAKPARAERDAGCHDLATRSAGEATDRTDDTDGLKSPRAGAGRTGGARNIHPTVKPIALMEWLVRLVTPPGGTVLDPFLGSGTTGCAAVREGFNFIGIEREAEYVAIAERRIRAAAAAPRAKPLRASKPQNDAQPSLFGGIAS